MPKSRACILAALISVVASLLLASVASAGAGNRRVQILDACDRETFDAAIEPGACLRAGGVTFDRFIGQLISMGEAPAWRFAPERLKLDSGGTITAVNRGGEFHTFTEVAAFGGGCVPELNQILGLTPVPECAGAPGIFGATGVPPDTSRTTAPLAAGTHRFMCIIHPWQRTTAQAG